MEKSAQITSDTEMGTNGNAVASVVPEAPERDTKFANNSFKALNYGGLNFVANSALSLGITYNVMPTKTAQKGIDKLANALKPIVTGWGKLKSKAGIGKEISEATRALNLHESARSTAEILCMCIAGSIILIPMKWMNDHKKPIVDKIDRWKNPEYHKYHKENNIAPTPLPHEEKEEKQGWGKLLSARLVAMASVIGIDAVMQNFNNNRVAKNKGNFDTAEWKLGSKIYDKLPTSVSEKFVRFFSARKTSDLSGIQKPILKRLEETVGTDRKRMLFSEQTRFLSKEISLTAILSLIMYAMTETGIVSSVLSKLGFKKPKEQHQAIDDILPDLPFVPITKGETNLLGDNNNSPREKYTDKIKPTEKKIIPPSQENFVHKYTTESFDTHQLSI